MSPRVTRRNEAKRLDAILALSLARFRRTVARLSDADLIALERRIALREIQHRWELGSHGLTRHRAPRTLDLLARRRSELAQERDRRAAFAHRQLRLVETESSLRAPDAPLSTDQAA